MKRVYCPSLSSAFSSPVAATKRHRPGGRRQPGAVHGDPAAGQRSAADSERAEATASGHGTHRLPSDERCRRRHHGGDRRFSGRYSPDSRRRRRLRLHIFIPARRRQRRRPGRCADVAAGQVTLTNGAGTFTRTQHRRYGAPTRRRSSTTRRASTSTSTRRRTPGGVIRGQLVRNPARCRCETGLWRASRCSWSPPGRVRARPGHKPGSSRREINRGGSRSSIRKYCKACHGEDATGDGPLAPKDTHPPNLRDADWKYGATDGEIFTNIRDGIGPKFDMKAMKSRMTATEIWNLVNYLRSIGSPPRAERRHGRL